MDLFQQQLQFVFNRPAVEPPWYWRPSPEAENPFGEEDAMAAFLFYEQLCQQPGHYLTAYTDDQVGQGLTYLFDASVCDLGDRFKTAAVPAERKAAALRALSVLFKEVMAPRCAPLLSAHAQEKLSPLHYICYMFWDVTSLANFLKYENQDELLLYAMNNMSDAFAAFMPKEAQQLLKMHFENKAVKTLNADDVVRQKKGEYASMDAETRYYYRAIASVMESCLYLDNPACIESGLHGLGHLATFQSDIAVPIVDRFLKKAKNQDKRLLDYAKSARTGMIL